MDAPALDQQRMAGAHRRLFGELDQLDDDRCRAPSRLPGWTVGHVLAHLANNADSHVRRAAAAPSGLRVEQYDGGLGGRTAEIEAGATRPAAELAADVRRTALACEAAFAGVAPGDWAAVSIDSSGLPRRLFELPARRWQEIEVHLVDLDLGVSWADWSDDFVQAWQPVARAIVWARLGAGSWPADFEFASPAAELAWLYGRTSVEGLPEPPPW